MLPPKRGAQIFIMVNPRFVYSLTPYMFKLFSNKINLN
jgi:hypothetical protein